MTGKPQNLPDESKNRILIPLKTGFSVGSFVVGLPLLVFFLFFGRFWLLVIGYNKNFSQIPEVQFLAIVIVGSFIISRTLCSDRKLMLRNGAEALGAGILAGLASVIWLFFLYLIMNYLGNVFFYDPDYQFKYVQIGLFIEMSVVIVMIQGFLTWASFWQSGFSRKNSSPASDAGNVNDDPGTMTRNLYILLILLVILPVALCFIAMRMDMVGPSYQPSKVALAIGPNIVLCERSNSETIDMQVLLYDQIGPGIYAKKINPFIDPAQNRTHFIILYNSLDVSDQATIDRQGLTLTIDPPEGVPYTDRTRAVLKGPAISNTTSKGHLEVIDINPARGSLRMRQKIVDMMV
jgi:hypothetical protein